MMKSIIIENRIDWINNAPAFFREIFNQYSSITNSKTKYIHIAINSNKFHRLKYLAMNINNKLAIMLIIGLKIQTKIILLLEISSFFDDSLNINHKIIALIKEYTKINSINDSTNDITEKLLPHNIS